MVVVVPAVAAIDTRPSNIRLFADSAVGGALVDQVASPALIVPSYTELSDEHDR